MNENYYNGAGLDISRAVHGELRVQQADAFGEADVMGAAAQGAAAMQNISDEMKGLQDYQARADSLRRLRELRGNRESKLKTRLAAAPGTKLSLLRADGEVDDEKMEAFMQEARDEVEQVHPKFWSLARLLRYEQEYADFESETRRHVEGLVKQHQLHGIRRAGEAALEEAEKLGDARGYQYELANQVDAGLLMEREAHVKMLEFNERLERKRLEALKAAGRAGDGRVISHEMMQSLKHLPVQSQASDGSGLVSTGPLDDTKDSMLTMKNTGLAALPADELLAGFNVAQRLADSGTVTLGSGVGRLAFELPESPGESTQKVAGVAQSFNGYSLADYRNSVAKVAAGYFSDESMSGMTNAQIVDALVNEVQMDGAADVWFEGDALAYKGWLQTELSRLSVTRGSGAVQAADRMLVGAEGRAGLNELLAQEVTQAEIASLGYGFNAVAAITRSGLRDKNDVLAPGFRQAVQEYERYRERWAQELRASDDKYTPSKEDTPAKRYKDDWQKFGKWYMKQADLYKSRVEALEEGVRDVYRQRAVDAVATLRLNGSYQLGTEVVQLDGKRDWAQEEKVLRYVLRQPLTNSELGSAKALAATKEKLYHERKNRAATYAQAYAEHKALLKSKQSAIAEEKARDKQEKKESEDLEKVLKQADDERLASYGRKVERKVKFGSVGKAGEDEPAVVVVPRAMYTEAAGALGAAGGGFYAFIPGVADGIPVMAGDVDAIQFNAPVLNLLDGKKNKLTGQQLRALANEGLMVPVQFSAFQKF